MGSEMSSLAEGFEISGYRLEWERLYFIKCRSFSVQHVTIEEMFEFADFFKNVIVKKLWSYRYEENGLINDDNRYRFLVIETSHGFFSIEQVNKCINVKFSPRMTDVVDDIPCGEVRILSEFWSYARKPIFERCLNKHANLKEIFEWIHMNNKLQENNSFFNYCTIL